MHVGKWNMTIRQKRLNLIQLIEQSATIENFLKRIVKKLKKILDVDVCSIYLYNSKTKKLMLRATDGLKASLENDLEIPIDKGIMGRVVRLKKPVLSERASFEKDFFEIPQSREKLFDNYLCIPITRYKKIIGVLGLQRHQSKSFSLEDVEHSKLMMEDIVDLVEEAKMLLEATHEQVQQKIVEKERKTSEEKKGPLGGMSAISKTKNNHKKANGMSGSKSTQSNLQQYHSAKNKKETKNFVYRDGLQRKDRGGTESGETNKIEIVSIAGHRIPKAFLYHRAIWLEEGGGLDKAMVHLLSDQIEKQSKSWTLNDFERALLLSKKQIKQMEKNISKRLDDQAGDIFAGHLLILKDEAYIGRIREKVKEGVSVGTAIYQATKYYEKIFSKSQMSSIKEKILDLRDIAKRMLFNLGQVSGEKDIKFSNRLAICRELLPSSLLSLSQRGVRGVILSSSQHASSHLSILAKSLLLPIFVVKKESIHSIEDEDRILIDLKERFLDINPSNQHLKQYRAKKETSKAKESSLWGVDGKEKKISKYVYTEDGKKIEVLANINLPSELKRLSITDMDIGLYRSEFLFLIRNHFPSEEDQYQFYRKMFSYVGKRKVGIRMLDLGGDKQFSGDLEKISNVSSNPIGLRSVRYLMKNPEIFATQLRAIFRASFDRAEIRLILPFISSVGELLGIKKFVKQTYEEMVKTENLQIEKKIQIGIMVEVPSVALMIRDFAEHVDFFSIGTNDLTQYLMAADRNMVEMEKYFTLYHPALLRLVHQVITVSNELKKEITLCGSMAEEKSFIPFLVGCGLRRFSVQLDALHLTHQCIGKTSFKKSKKLVAKVLEVTDEEEARELLTGKKEAH